MLGLIKVPSAVAVTSFAVDVDNDDVDNVDNAGILRLRLRLISHSSRSARVSWTACRERWDRCWRGTYITSHPYRSDRERALIVDRHMRCAGFWLWRGFRLAREMRAQTSINSHHHHPVSTVTGGVSSRVKPPPFTCQSRVMLNIFRIDSSYPIQSNSLHNSLWIDSRCRREDRLRLRADLPMAQHLLKVLSKPQLEPPPLKLPQELQLQPWTCLLPEHQHRLPG